MSDEEKQAIERLKLNTKTAVLNWGKSCIARNDDIETVLNLIEKQQAEIEKYKEMYAVSVADRVNNAFKQEHKNNEDLEMLYKGCQIELEEKDKIIDEMAKYIVTDIKNAIIVKDICRNKANSRCFDKDNYVDCKDCIKEYFKKKVEGK